MHIRSGHRVLAAAFGAIITWTGAAGAQSAPGGWSYAVDGLAGWQGNADLGAGGTVSANRAFLRAGAFYRSGTGASAGVALGSGWFDYEFSLPGNTLWGDVRDLRVAVPLSFRLDSGADLLIVPQARWDYEDGASASDGFTGGVFAGIAWQVSDSLRIGPALGVFSQLDDDVSVFPALLVDWQIADRWRLSTATAPGATQGPGLSLSYAWSDSVSLSLSARYEEMRFRLNGTGLAPGGVGEDSSVPVVLSLDYRPNPAVSLNLFAGAEFGGEMRLFNAAGAEIARQDYDTAPVAGFAFRVLF